MGLAFNFPPDQVSGTLLTRIGGTSKNCTETVSGPLTSDLQIGSRILQTFQTTLTVTNIQYGANTGNTNPPNYCTTVAHVGDQLTLNGTGTCAGSDMHEICNQQFTVTGADSGGNLLSLA